MLKLVAVAAALAFATQASAQSVIDKAKQKQQQEQQQQKQQQQQQKASAAQGTSGAPRNPLKKKKYEDCSRKADAQKLSGDAHKRNVDQCMQAKG